MIKNILLVSHCILNTASKVAEDEENLVEEYAAKDRLMHTVLDKNIQIIQLPCPEFYMYGSRRWGHVKDQFNHPHFKKECEKMLEPVFMQLEEYLTYPEEFNIVGIVSVEGSPSCGYKLTCKGSWGGEISGSEFEKRKDTLKMTEESGVLMEIIEKELKHRNMNIPIMSIDKAEKCLKKL